MTITREEARTIAQEVVGECRAGVDDELRKLHEQDKANAWTEERATKIATDAANMAVRQITDRFYMSVGKKTVATIGVLVVGGVIFVKDEAKRWIGWK